MSAKLHEYVRSTIVMNLLDEVTELLERGLIFVALKIDDTLNNS